MPTTLPRLPRIRPRSLQSEGPRETLLPAFKPIGIQSVAAAAAQVKREPEQRPDHELPPGLRQDWAA